MCTIAIKPLDADFSFASTPLDTAAFEVIMKILSKLLFILLGLIVALCTLIGMCAINPELTERISAILGSPNVPAVASSQMLQSPSGGAGTFDDGSKGAAGDVSISDDSSDLSDGEADSASQNYTQNYPQGAANADNYTNNGKNFSDQQDTSMERLRPTLEPLYEAPTPSQLSVPQQVADRSGGYQPIQDEREQIEDALADEILQELGNGSTGDGLEFDPTFYPYYQMLDDTGQHLYRQIYANANDLNDAFVPLESVTASQLKRVFEAVYNDHPELFWLNTTYAGMYRSNGKCVEIDLQFNRTARNLDSSKAEFDSKAEQILSGAQNLVSDYEKERYVHDSLIDSVAYDLKSEMSQSAYSALVNGRTVCAGYARAFQYLMQQLDIPCYYCTGFAGEDHAWNIVSLDDGYYNVDSTWDDVEGGRYEYFNKSDQDYGSTHIRKDLSIYLPPCKGRSYSNLESEDSSAKGGSSSQNSSESADGGNNSDNSDSSSGLRTLEDAGFSEDEVIYSIDDYYADCRSQILEHGLGSYEFYNVIDGEDMLKDWNESYDNYDYRQGYMNSAMVAVGAKNCNIHMEAEKLADGRYLVKHQIEIN